MSTTLSVLSVTLPDQVTKLLVIWLCSYAIGAVVPIFAMFVIKYNRYYKMVYVYSTLMIGYKVAIPVTLGVEAWEIIGSCYLPTSMKVTVIVTNVLEAAAYFVMILLLYRGAKVIREDNIQKLVNAKTFIH